MGKLAERYTDAARSGVYRVDSAEVPLRAALEARAHVLELAGGDALALAGLPQLIPPGDGRPQVVLVRHDASVCLIEALGRIARDCRANGVPFFAIVVDPAGALALPPLYRERSVSAPSGP
jgi:hypothetical protein